MTSKSRAVDDKLARMARPAPVVPEPAAPVQVKSRPVRVSLDLTPALYDDLTAWNREAAHRIGRTKVTNAETLRSLVRVLLDDAGVADEVTRRLRADPSK